MTTRWAEVVAYETQITGRELDRYLDEAGARLTQGAGRSIGNPDSRAR